ncbi:hypothetical protein DITRI_Ditri09bG0058900 [Diplodiscus trichospermus]
MSSASSLSLWLLKPSPSAFCKFRSCPSPPPSSSPPCYRVVCCSGSSQHASSTDLDFALHDALEYSGADTHQARKARKGFLSQVQKLSDIERETSISINRCVDLGRTALYIAAEDVSLVSLSSVPFLVDTYLERLDDLSMGYCSHYNSSCRLSRENFLESIEKYLYGKKGFRRSSAKNQAQPGTLYLHSVLKNRTGSAVMLSLIHSEILKMFRMWGLLDFDVEVFFPHDLHGLPRAYDKQKSKESDQPHIMTVQMLLEEILRNLKAAFWPFQHGRADSLFLRAADAANCMAKSNSIEKSYQLASSNADQYLLERDVWTSDHFGNMRLALSACERLILLKTDPKEMRDYSILLYHCGLYELARKYLNLYQDTKSSTSQSQSPNLVSILEEDAVEKLFVRLNLISMEEASLSLKDFQLFLRLLSDTNSFSFSHITKIFVLFFDSSSFIYNLQTFNFYPFLNLGYFITFSIQNFPIVATSTNYTTTRTWPPPAWPLPPPPPPPPSHGNRHNPTNMLGLHNIFLIAPPPTQENQHPPPPAPQAFNQDYNLTDTNLWTLKKSIAHESPVCQKKDGVLNGVGDEDGCFKVCRDCGNRAKKECGYSRCRTCCKSRGYDCATHMKSTWVPASRRKDRKVVVVGDEDGGADVAAGGGNGGGSSGSSSCGGKRPRILSSTSNGTSSSNAASKSLNFEAATTHQDSRFKKSLPGQVRAPAVFRCIQVTAISDGEAEVAYQATVNISGHVFKGFLYDQGVDVKNAFPCISKMHFESSSSGKDRDSSSPIVDPRNTFAASGD